MKDFAKKKKNGLFRKGKHTEGEVEVLMWQLRVYTLDPRHLGLFC